MEAHYVEFLSMLVRWLHIIAGIAWIGSSFYFIWLDNSLEAPAPDSDAAKKGVGGELWAVHGGGFYNPQKYLVAPAALPDKLHWLGHKIGEAVNLQVLEPALQAASVQFLTEGAEVGQQWLSPLSLLTNFNQTGKAGTRPPIPVPGRPAPVANRWTGIMAFGATKQPILEEKAPHVFLGVRMGGMGVAIGSAVGERLAEMMLPEEERESYTF